MVEDSRFTGFDHDGAEAEHDDTGPAPERLLRELLRGGHLVQERAQSYYDEVLERSRKRTDALVEALRRQVGNQIAALGLATRQDMERLERRLTQPGKSQPARGSTQWTHARTRPSPAAPSDEGGHVDGQP